MSKLVNDSLPFFINLSEPIAVYIIANEVIGLTDHWAYAFHPGRAFEILVQLFDHHLTKAVFPEKLVEHFQEIPENVIKAVPHLSIAGEEDEFGCQLCLFLNVSINEKSPLPVSLHDFTIIHWFYPGEKLYDFTPLNLKVNLSAEEVFSIFANICASCTAFWLDTPRREEVDSKLNLTMLKEKLKDQKNGIGNLSPSRELNYRITSFTIDYLRFLIEHIENKEITPESILRLSGGRILAFLSEIPIVKEYYNQVMNEVKNNYHKLSMNRKVSYYTLLEMGLHLANYQQQQIELFYEQNKELMESIRKELTKPFPLRTGKFSEMPYDFW